MKMKKNKYLISPDIKNDTLTKVITGIDQDNNQINAKVIKEKALTIFLNNQEIVTLMSIGDHPKYLSVGYLLNQNMLKLMMIKLNLLTMMMNLELLLYEQIEKQIMKKFLEKKLQQVDVLKEQFLVIFMRKYRK